MKKTLLFIDEQGSEQGNEIGGFRVLFVEGIGRSSLLKKLGKNYEEVEKSIGIGEDDDRYDDVHEKATRKLTKVSHIKKFIEGLGYEVTEIKEIITVSTYIENLYAIEGTTDRINDDE